MIIAKEPSGAPYWFVSPLARSPQSVQAHAGQRKTGYRLAPGMQLDARALDHLLTGAVPDMPCAALISEACRPNAHVAEALACLSQAHSDVRAVCADLGVSARALQKLLARHGLPAPVFWHQLARARRAAGSILDGGALADVCADAGYSDQPHMTRSFQRFFGISPSRLAGSDLSAQVRHPALATGAQISTRIPSGSLT